MSYQRLEDQIDLRDLANDRYKLRWPTHRTPVQIHCPFHDDSTPSARYYGEERGGYCWTCQRPITPVGLVAEQEGLSWFEAAALLGNWYGISNDPDPDEAEIRALLAEVESPTLSPRAAEDVRRAASMQRRMVGRPWQPPLLLAYDELDLTKTDPQGWLDRTALR